ncbi:conjugative transposon protein TraN [Mucilaginibacter gynuensis]|uniref:Conjugative transposon protein TraN n=1 Tax=Mucilaginibacter gynuensis TaxID=1302236 RepID=A0ABP8HI34_9SPHI
MKHLIFLLLTLFSGRVFAQSLPVVQLPGKATLHFVSPEPIQYVDISTGSLEGDLPLPNLCRIHLRDSLNSFTNAIITIAGETFLAQYQLVPGAADCPARIEILPADTRPLDIAGIGLSQNQLKKLSLGLLSLKVRGSIQKNRAFGITARLNQVYTVGDYIFLDLAYENSSRLKYAIEDLRFAITDKKITKATNVQSFEVNPVFVLLPVPSFSKRYRNIFVFKKMSFPGSKVLQVTLSEKQVSGRVISLDISYRDILDADIPPPLQQ